MLTLSHDHSAPQAPQAPVLVQSAITGRTEKPSFEGVFKVDVYADLLKIKRVSRPTTEPDRKRGSRRGTITSFSSKSRKRLIEKQAQVRSWDGAFFVTGTLSDEVSRPTTDLVSHSPETFKNWLAALRHRIKRRFPQAGGIVRVEWKERKSGALTGLVAPHFHMLIRGVDMHPVLFRKWFQRAWSSVVYQTDQPPRLLRTQCDEIHSRKHAARYAAKYAAKLETLSSNAHNPNLGRHWLSFGNLDAAPALTITLRSREVVELRRMASRLLKARGSRYSRRLARGSPHCGFSVFGLGDLSEANAGVTILRMFHTL